MIRNPALFYQPQTVGPARHKYVADAKGYTNITRRNRKHSFYKHRKIL